MKEYLDLISQPRKFFRSVEKENIKLTLKKLLPAYILLSAIASILGHFITLKLNEFFGTSVGPAGLAFDSILSFVLIIISTIVFPVLLALSLKILGVKHSFSQNLKILLYVSIPFSAFTILAYLLVFAVQGLTAQIFVYHFFVAVLLVAGFIYEVIGLSEIYKISKARATGAMFLQLALILGALLVLAILLIIIIVIFALMFDGGIV